MGVTRVEELVDRSGGIDGQFARTYKRMFRVYTNDRHDGPKTAVLACGVAIGRPYAMGNESDGASFCVGLDAQNEAVDGLTWVVTASYGPFDPNTGENPLDDPWDVSWTFAPYEKVADVDVDGNAVVNSAGDYFDPPIARDDSRASLSVTRSEATFSVSIASSYKDSINSTTFLGQPPRTVKCTNIGPQRVYSPYLAAYYWKVAYQFDFNPDTWVSQPLDQGFRSRSGGVKHQILTDGVPAAEPHLLDGAGGVLASGATPVYLAFHVYPEKDFGAFNINLSDIGMS